MAWKHRTIKQEWEVVGLYKDYSISQIAKLTGLNKWTVRDILLKYHIPMRGRSYHSAQFRYAYDKYKWHRILYYLYWDLRLPLHEVARRTNVEVGTVRRRMRTLGIAIRSPGESNKGQKRKSYNYRPDLPTCATEGCQTKVLKEGEIHCAVCRRRIARQENNEPSNPNDPRRTARSPR